MKRGARGDGLSVTAAVASEQARASASDLAKPDGSSNLRDASGSAPLPSGDARVGRAPRKTLRSSTC